MPRTKNPNKPKRNIWKEPSPYGFYNGPRGSVDQWRAAFAEAMSPEQAKEILGDASPWSILGLVIGASKEDIKQAYRKMALKYHPDRNPIDKKKWAEKKFKEIHAAYVTLGEGR